MLVSLIYGATFSLAKVIMPSLIKPYGFILLRVMTAAILFILVQRLFIREKIRREDILPLLISSFFGVAANMLMFFKGLSITSPINGSVLMLVTPIFVLLLSVIVNKEPITTRKIAGMLLAGFAALFLIGGANLKFVPEQVLGDVLIMMNALSYAIFLVYVRKLLQRYNAITVSMYNFIFGTLIVLPFGFYELKEVDWSLFQSNHWWIVGFVLIGTTFLTYLLNAYALGKANASLVGSYIYLQPVVATSMAMVLGQDDLTFIKALCIIVIFAGVYLVNIKKTVKYVD